MWVGRRILFDHLSGKKKYNQSKIIHMLKKMQPYMYLSLTHLVKSFIAQIVVIFWYFQLRHSKFEPTSIIVTIKLLKK